MEKVENCEADVLSRKRRHSSIGHSNSNPTSRTVYLEPEPLFLSKKISIERTQFNFPPGIYTIWYDELLAGNKRAVKLCINYTGTILFSNRWVLTVKITTAQHPEGQLQTFSIGCPNKLHTFDIDVPENDAFEMVVCNFQAILNGDIQSRTSYGHRFDRADRPHDIVLNFGNEKLYCFKVVSGVYIFYEELPAFIATTALLNNVFVLAMVSDYFERLFFSETADPNMTSHNLPDLDSEAVMELLNISFLQDGIVTVGSLNIREIQALFFLEMPIFTRRATSGDISYRFLKLHCVGKEHTERCTNIMIALELTEKHNLPFLQSECTTIFYNYFTSEQKKNFFAENADRLKKLSWKTMIKFTTEAFGNKSTNDLNVVFGEAEPGPLETMTNKDGFIDKLCDVTLVVGDRRFTVHKEYLAFWSPYFDRLFFGSFSEAGKDEIELKDVDPLEFSILISKIYSPSSSPIKKSNLFFLLKLADRFEMKSIMIMCARYLDRKVIECPRSAVDIPEIPLMDLVELADTYNFIDVQNSFLVKLGSMNKVNSQSFRTRNYSRFGKLSRRLLQNIIWSL